MTPHAYWQTLTTHTHRWWTRANHLPLTLARALALLAGALALLALHLYVASYVILGVNLTGEAILIACLLAAATITSPPTPKQPDTARFWWHLTRLLHTTARRLLTLLWVGWALAIPAGLIIAPQYGTAWWQWIWTPLAVVLVRLIAATAPTTPAASHSRSKQHTRRK